MRRDEFLDEVCQRGDLHSRAEAEVAVRATLETLGTFLPDAIADNLAALLPRDIGGCLRADPDSELPPDPEDGIFLDGVCRRTGAPPERAAALATVVLDVVDDATDGAARRHLLVGVPGVPGSDVG